MLFDELLVNQHFFTTDNYLHDMQLCTEIMKMLSVSKGIYIYMNLCKVGIRSVPQTPAVLVAYILAI